MNLGNKIKELRQRNCITQEQLANHLSVSPQCISKWENSITMPDIQLLPQISVFFGVSLDELFDLTDSAYLERISNMIRNKRFPEESEFRWAEKFLKGKIESGISKGECSTLLADLYNHMADGYRFKAECSAKEAIAIDPEKKYNHSLLRMAQQGSIPDWNYANHSKRIAFYQNFVSEHPNYERGYFFLLDELLADYRLKEAEIVLDKMRFQCDNLRVPLYCGLILWQKGKQEQAQQSWAEMLKQYSSDWLAYACMGDCMAKICHYGEAILNYRKALELQEKPRYTDSAIAIAHIYEIQKDYPNAIEAWKEVIRILKEEHHVTDGEGIDAPMREIKRLKRLISEKNLPPLSY